MTNDSLIVKKSFLLFVIGFIINIAVTFLWHITGLPLGWCLGYALSLIILKINTVSVDAVIQKRMPGVLIAANYALAMIIYVGGLLVGFMFPAICHYMGVFLSYFIIKVTIYWMAFTERRKMNGLDSE